MHPPSLEDTIMTDRLTAQEAKLAEIDTREGSVAQFCKDLAEQLRQGSTSPGVIAALADQLEARADSFEQAVGTNVKDEAKKEDKAPAASAPNSTKK